MSKAYRCFGLLKCSDRPDSGNSQKKKYMGLPSSSILQAGKVMHDDSESYRSLGLLEVYECVCLRMLRGQGSLKYLVRF